MVSHDAGAVAYLVRDPAGIDANGPCMQVDPELASCRGRRDRLDYVNGGRRVGHRGG